MAKAVDKVYHEMFDTIKMMIQFHGDETKIERRNMERHEEESNDLCHNMKTWQAMGGMAISALSATASAAGAFLPDESWKSAANIGAKLLEGASGATQIFGKGSNTQKETKIQNVQVCANEARSERSAINAFIRQVQDGLLNLQQSTSKNNG